MASRPLRNRPGVLAGAPGPREKGERRRRSDRTPCPVNPWSSWSGSEAGQWAWLAGGGAVSCRTPGWGPLDSDSPDILAPLPLGPQRSPVSALLAGTPGPGPPREAWRRPRPWAAFQIPCLAGSLGSGRPAHRASGWGCSAERGSRTLGALLLLSPSPRLHVAPGPRVLLLAAARESWSASAPACLGRRPREARRRSVRFVSSAPHRGRAGTRGSFIPSFGSAAASPSRCPPAAASGLIRARPPGPAGLPRPGSAGCSPGQTDRRRLRREESRVEHVHLNGHPQTVSENQRRNGGLGGTSGWGEVRAVPGGCRTVSAAGGCEQEIVSSCGQGRRVLSGDPPWRARPLSTFLQGLREGVSFAWALGWSGLSLHTAHLGSWFRTPRALSVGLCQWDFWDLFASFLSSWAARGGADSQAAGGTFSHLQGDGGERRPAL